MNDKQLGADRSILRLKLFIFINEKAIQKLQKLKDIFREILKSDCEYNLAMAKIISSIWEAFCLTNN